MTLYEKYIRYIVAGETDGVSQSESVVFEIISDLKGRKGIGNEFEQIDSEIQEEIIDAWINIVESHGQTAGN